MDLQTFLFWTLALLTGLSAIAVVVTQNIVRCAAWLLFTLGGTAGIYFLIGADFVGATQIIVYVGGILILVVFGVMLTAQGPFITMKAGPAEWAIATVVGLTLFTVLTVTTLGANWTGETSKRAPSAPVVKEMAKHLTNAEDATSSVVMGTALLGLTGVTPERELSGIPVKQGREKPKRTQMAYLLPFEIVSVHLLVVLIGAAYLARAKRRRGTVS
jgi:NADH:ubiquinone oxidoreductase subunit 6 (subunit J)